MRAYKLIFRIFIQYLRCVKGSNLFSNTFSDKLVRLQTSLMSLLNNSREIRVGKSFLRLLKTNASITPIVKN